MTYINRTHLADGPQLDAFGRLRVSAPVILHDFKRVGAAPEWHRVSYATGSGTVDFEPNKSSYAVSIDDTGDVAELYGAHRSVYQPGKSLLIFITGVYGTLTANVQQDMGYFDDHDGYFLRASGTTLQMVRRSYTTGSAVDTSVNQSSWNIDPLNGTGPSGVTVDVTKATILVIDVEWLGMGRARLGFVIDGNIFYCHEFLNANSLSTVHISNPNLVPRWRIEALPGYVGPATLTMYATCASVQVEGGSENVGAMYAAHTGATGRLVNIGVTSDVMAVRIAPEFTRYAHVRPLSISVVTSANTTFLVQLVLNSSNSVAGTWTSVGTESTCEYNTGRTGTVSGGSIIAAVYASNDSNQVDIPLVDFALGVNRDSGSEEPDVMSVVVTNVAGVNGTFYASINLREEA